MKQAVTIQSVLGGQSLSQYVSAEGQYLAGLGIDPDYPLTSSDTRTSGVLVPTIYEKFSGANVNASVVAIVNNPKDTNTYIVLSNGRLISYNSALGAETLIGTVTGSVGRGAWYYNNYIYIATGTDLSRYGPLDGTPALTNTVWTGATLGSLTALNNTTYPTLRGVSIPNHWGCIHGDGSAYFLDFGGATPTAQAGQGLVHRINTRKVTSEGDTNGTTVASAYNVLDLPFGFYPTAICSYSTDLAILAIQTTDTTINQGRSCLFLWDPTNTDTFYRQVWLPDPIATAMMNWNGTLVIWSGNANNGVRVSMYAGGEVITDRNGAYLEEGLPPLAGAVDALGNRVVWGGFTTYPENTACVYGLGSKNAQLPRGVHNIVRTTSSNSTNQICTAVKFVQQASNVTPRLLPAWTDGAGQGIDKLSTTATYASVWRSAVINVNTKFRITKIRFALGAVTASGMTLTPKVFFDDASNSVTLTTINSTNYSGKRHVTYEPPAISATLGENNFFIELRWTGTVALPILLPIKIELDVFEDD